jgi:capsular exopolysaccharide synthesis family protein
MIKNSSDSNKGIDFNDVLKPYFQHWKWFAFTAILALILGFIFIRYATPQYQVQSKIQIAEEGNSGSELSSFTDLGVLGAGTNAIVEDEIEILSSRSNFIDVVKNLGLNIRVISKGRVHDITLYQNPPIRVNPLAADSVIYNLNGFFRVQIISATSFKVTESDDLPSRQYNFGTTFRTNLGEFVITPSSDDFSDYLDREFEVNIKPLEFVAQDYQKRVQIALANEKSKILRLSFNDPIPQRGMDLLNQLAAIYNTNAAMDKKAIADGTKNFINERIAEIAGNLTNVDQSAEELKESRGITDVASQSNINLNLGASRRQELQNARVDLSIATQMKALLDNQYGFEILPANLTSDGAISSYVAQYNQLVNSRNRLLRSSNEQNPIIVNLDQELMGLKQTLKSSLSSAINNLNLTVNNLSGELSRINASIYSAPGNERAVRDIERKQETIEALYLYMLQKREESQITFASSAPKSNVIDAAYNTSPLPVSPRKPIIMLLSLMLGLLIPFSVIYANQILDNKIHNKIGLEKLIGDVPVLAELPKLGKKDKTLVMTGDRSVLAEALRILRTNLDYYLKFNNHTKGGRTIFVTSSVPGEGKTFVASNLAMIYAKTNKKVLLIGGDIRNPKLDQFYSGKNVDKLKRVSGSKENIGLTDYLLDDQMTAKEITNSMLVADQVVDIIHSGKLIPNPGELLLNERLELLVDDVRTKYDYVIVDTAPMVVVTDTLLMTKYADLVLYVTRADVTNIKVLDFPQKLKEEGKLPNLAFVVNGVKDNNLGYGGQYGYGYGKSVKKWWNFSS